ncbi:MAG: aminotransferase class V-fold PLP-dependent enzyme, partial [Candidatus Limnocylindrales bacterium]
MSAVDPLDVEVIRKDFPLLTRTVHERPIVYLDSASSSLQPRSVMAAMDHYYETTHANVHRAVYATAEGATELYEGARRKVGRFIGAPDPKREVVFTKNATEALNLVTNSWGRTNLKQGDVVVLTEMEHHANIVPWLILAEQLGLELRYLPIDGDGRLDLSDMDKTLDGAAVVAVTAMSNVLGTINPIPTIAEAAHRHGAVAVVDGAQSVPHLVTDVKTLGADFLAFSAHKMEGPTGIGVLWARRELLEGMPPFLGGGGMILDVALDRFGPAEPPWRFEAGTPPIAEAVGLAAAVDYLSGVGIERITAHERLLTAYAIDALADRLGGDCRIFGPPAGGDRGGVLSLAYRDVHAHDVAQVLDQFGVCVRPGHH